MRSCEFSQSRFLEDIRTTAEAIAAPFSYATTRAVLDAYGPAFSEGAVLLRTTDRTGDDLNYRFYAGAPWTPSPWPDARDSSRPTTPSETSYSLGASFTTELRSSPATSTPIVD